MVWILVILKLFALTEGKQNKSPACAGTWTEWQDRTQPVFGGGEEYYIFADPQPCARPIAIDYRTSNGQDPTDFKLEYNVLGVTCKDEEQAPGIKCPGLGARFCCPYESTCDSPDHSWTRWISIHSPEDSTGDYELLSEMVEMDQDAFCKNPTSIDARLKTTGESWTQGKDCLYKFDPTVGLICKNDDQPPDKCCEDYEVRFCCKLCSQDDFSGESPTSEDNPVVNLLVR